MNLDQYTTQTGVYLMKDGSGKVIYVGKANNLKNRLKQYFSISGDSRPMVPILRSQIAQIDTIITPSEKEALLLENTLIKKHQPKFNAILKDDKTFISLMVTSRHPWPMIRLVRYRGKPKENGLYFGPYTNAYAARQTLELLTRLFPLRQCSDEELKRRTRPCLLYSINRCIAPCVGKCTKEEYQSFVEGAVKFLKGQDREVIKELSKEMEKASEALEFERAAALLQTIRQIEHVTQKAPLLSRATGRDADAWALYRQGGEVMLVQLLFREGNLIGSEHFSFSQAAEEEADLLSSFLIQQYKDQKVLPKEILLPFSLPNSHLLEEILSTTLLAPKKGDKHKLISLAYENAKALFMQEKDQRQVKEQMLLDLQETLRLTRFPKRIECFDTSNIGGSDPVACMVAFTNGEKEKKRIRLFHIRGLDKPDDYAAMKQVLTRRLVRAKEEEDLPDLIVVDGGKGQLNIALEVFRQLDIASVDVIGLAKENSRHDKGLTQEKIFVPHDPDPILLPPHSPLLLLLQQVRDEAHAQAIRFHRKQRSKRTLSSGLDALPGIGPVKRKKLLRHFGSLEKIRSATSDQLSQVPGLSKKDISLLLKKSTG